MFPNTTTFVVSIVVEQDDNNSWYAFTPGFKGIHESGSTSEEACQTALETLKETIEIYIDKGYELPENEYFKAIDPSHPVHVSKLRHDSIVFALPPAFLSNKLKQSGSRV